MRLWKLGNLFSYEALIKTAQDQLIARCQKYWIQRIQVKIMINRIPFIDDLIAAIKAAWDPDFAENPLRQRLLTLFLSLQRYLSKHAHQGCAELLRATLDFALDVAMATLRLDVPPAVNDHELWVLGVCNSCGSAVDVWWGWQSPKELDIILISDTSVLEVM